MSRLSYEAVLEFLENTITFCRSFQEHLNRPDQILEQIKDAGLKLKGSTITIF